MGSLKDFVHGFLNNIIKMYSIWLLTAGVFTKEAIGKV